MKKQPLNVVSRQNRLPETLLDTFKKVIHARSKKVSRALQRRADAEYKEFLLQK